MQLTWNVCICKTMHLEGDFMSFSETSWVILPLSTCQAIDFLDKFVNLEELRLSRNQLTCIIPPTIGKLYKLRYLILSQNMVTGTIPSSIANSSLLTELNLDHNNLRGRIPSKVLQNVKICYILPWTKTI